MDGSNGNIVSLLERIAGRMDTVTDGIQGLRQEIQGLRHDMNRGFSQVNGRIDKEIDFMGHHHGDHEERIRVLEERVLGKAKG